jgi:small subunit ribosomal protein S4
MNHGCRKCRREGVKLFLKGERCFSPKCAVTTRPYVPGQHGPSSYTKLTEYGKQLREKQKVKKIYGINETQLKNYYLKASRRAGDTSENLIQLLESRLDSIIYRLGFTPSKTQARQMVSHRFFKVNTRTVNIASINITEKDVIAVKPGKNAKFDGNANLPSWISYDGKKMIAKLKSIPNKEEIELPFDINLVIEYYSR